MTKVILILWLCAMLFCTGCGGIEATPQKQTAAGRGLDMPLGETKLLDKESAISIAKEDAAKAYKSLEGFDVFACETPRVWHVFFELKDGNLDGGTPEYIIDKKTGSILRKNYYQ